MRWPALRATSWRSLAPVPFSCATICIPASSLIIGASGRFRWAECLRPPPIRKAGTGFVSCCCRRHRSSGAKISSDKDQNNEATKLRPFSVQNKPRSGLLRIGGKRVMTVDTPIVVALAALAGSVVGACSSIVATFIGQRLQTRAARLARDLEENEEL